MIHVVIHYTHISHVSIVYLFLFYPCCGPTVPLFQVSVRHAKTHRWPKISNMKLTHNHSVDRNAIDVKVRLASKLTEEQLGQVKQMTSEKIERRGVGLQ